MKPTHVDWTKIRNAYEMRERGFTNRAIAQVISVSPAQVGQWTAHPEKFSPFVDEIALERAMEGDRGAYESFSYKEQEIFWEKMTRYMLPQSGAAEWEDVDYINSEYLSSLSEFLGITRKTMGTSLTRAKRRMVSRND